MDAKKHLDTQLNQLMSANILQCMCASLRTRILAHTDQPQGNGSVPATPSLPHVTAGISQRLVFLENRHDQTRVCHVQGDNAGHALLLKPHCASSAVLGMHWELLPTVLGLSCNIQARGVLQSHASCAVLRTCLKADASGKPCTSQSQTYWPQECECLQSCQRLHIFKHTALAVVPLPANPASLMSCKGGFDHLTSRSHIMHY